MFTVPVRKPIRDGPCRRNKPFEAPFAQPEMVDEYVNTFNILVSLLIDIREKGKRTT